MEQTEQVVEFRALGMRYSMQIEPERRGFDQFGVLATIPAKIISFENGYYKTSDPEIIKRIRASQAYREKRVFEITDADRDIFRPQPKQKTLRGPVSTASIQVEAGVKPDEHRAALKNNTACKDCGKEFKDDLGGKRVRLHEISHRRGKPQGVSVEEK